MSEELCFSTISELSRLMDSGALSAAELMGAVISRTKMPLCLV